MPHHAAGRTACPDLLGPFRRLAGARRGAVALPLGQGSGGRRRRHQRRARRYRHRHAQDPVQRCEIQTSGTGHHRRRTPLRRAPEGSAEGAARRSRRADADRHAHSAHAGHVAGRHPRLLRHRHRAAKAPGDQDLRAPRRRQHLARGAAARTQARRPVLLPAQRSRDH
ncbi:hypothetical protein D3C78_1043810 [compost metagenome]